MATTAARRPVMTLYSGGQCPASHRVRIVLAEKSLTADVIEVDPVSPPEDLIDLGGSSNVPTLVDRDLVLYDSAVIAEYLDERFPHPPLMPVDPVSRARVRTMLTRIEDDWYGLIDDINDTNAKRSAQAIKSLREGLTVIAPFLGNSSFLMSDDFSLIECAMAPILWRADCFGIDLPTQAKSVMEYGKRLFDRNSFQDSLTESEREMSD